jgi:hypothetical protein
VRLQIQGAQQIAHVRGFVAQPAAGQRGAKGKILLHVSKLRFSIIANTTCSIWLVCDCAGSSSSGRDSAQVGSTALA